MLPESTYQLRPYQQELVTKILNCWQLGQRRVLAQLPTAGGKTVIFAAIAAEFVARGERVLIVAHRCELLEQARHKLTAVISTPIGMVKRGYKFEPEAPLQIGSIQTLVRRLDSLPPASLLVIDEAHHASATTYVEVLQKYPQAYILGVSATPLRTDGRGFQHLFDELISGPSVRQLINLGYLSKYKLFASAKSIDTRNVSVVGGEYNQRQLGEAANTQLLLGDLVSTWQRHASGKRTIVFGVDVLHSQAIASAYLAVGVPAAHIDGGTPALERAAILERFKQGEILVLSNCNLFTEGVDVPAVQVIQCAKPTRSLALWLQMLGRGLRVSPGKEFTVILDHSENWLSLGMPCDERKWSLGAMSIEEDRWSLKCPDCNHVFRPLERKPLCLRRTKLVFEAVCPSCETVFEYERGVGGEPPPPRVIEKDESATLELIQAEPNAEILQELHRLKQIQEKRGFRPGWIYYKLIESHPNLGLLELREVAKILGYKPSWALFKLKEIQQLQPA